MPTDYSYESWPPAAPRSTYAIAVTALVLSVVALVLLLLLALGASGLVLMGDPADEDVPPLRGTAAQVVADRPYPGEKLAVEARRVLEGDWAQVDTMRCPDTAAVEQDVTTRCTGSVDGEQTRVLVTFEDDAGHFGLEES